MQCNDVRVLVVVDSRSTRSTMAETARQTARRVTICRYILSCIGINTPTFLRYSYTDCWKLHAADRFPHLFHNRSITHTCTYCSSTDEYEWYVQ